MSKGPALLVALAGALMLAVAMGVGRFAFTPLLPMMQKDQGLSLILGGWLATSNYLGYFLGAYTAAWLRATPGKIIAFSLLATAVLTAGMAFTELPVFWILLRGLAGVASAWVLVFTSAWALHRLAAADAPGLRGLLFGGVGFGIMLAGLLCMLFLRWDWSAERSWFALGVAALLISLLALPAFGAGASSEVAVATGARISADPRQVLGTALAYGVFGFGYIIPATFLPAMAKQRLSDPALFGWAWPVFGFAGLVSTLVAGRLMLRYSNRRVWGVSHLVMGVGVIVPVLLQGLAGILLAALCVGGTFMVITAAGIQEARRLAPHDPSRLMARFTAAFAIGQILGPLCVSLLPKGSGSLTTLLIAAAALLLASGVALLLRDAD
ncbi:MAG TPA: YbfB/YjiJ family MFS transporter [Gammaproteobacteria bacterium]|nr:YbfB/YjiJ family MFS transporter [Gammaproteobacteria bacterium]